MTENEGAVATYPSTSNLLIGHSMPKPGEERQTIGTWNGHPLVKLVVEELTGDGQVVAKVFSDREYCCEEEDHVLELTIIGKVVGRFIPETQVISVKDCPVRDA